MPEPQDLNADEQELAEALERLELAPLHASSQKLWYRAGYEAGRRRGNVWRAAAAVSLIASATLLAARPWARPVTVERVVFVHAPSEPASIRVSRFSSDEAPVLSAANLRLRDAVLRNGLDALPTASGGGDDQPPPTAGGRLPPGEGGSL